MSRTTRSQRFLRALGKRHAAHLKKGETVIIINNPAYSDEDIDNAYYELIEAFDRATSEFDSDEPWNHYLELYKAFWGHYPNEKE